MDEGKDIIGILKFIYIQRIDKYNSSNGKYKIYTDETWEII